MALVKVMLPWGTTEVVDGTPVGEILSAGPANGDEVVAARINNRLVALDARIEAACEVTAVKAHSSEGEEVVRRTAALLLHGVCRQLFPEARLKVGQSLRGGYYYAVSGQHPDLKTMAAALHEGFCRETETGRQIIRHEVSLEAAIDLFEHLDPAKARLLRIWPSHRVPLVTCLDFTDIRHGPYALHARSARGYRIEPYPPGLILVFDGQQAGDTSGSSLFRAYAETRHWNEQAGIATIADLNDKVLDGTINGVIQLTEGQHEKKIAGLADGIASRGGAIRLVCVAGPSSSGKTTFVKRLSIQLKVCGITPQILSMDDYYVDREATPKDEDGEFDFEALEAIDLPLFHEQLADLVAGKEIMTPVYDFKEGKRRPEARWRKRQLKENEVLLIEGIHGLNPVLTQSIPTEQKYRIFINALTQVCIDDHNRIRTSDVRLLRRIVRDRRYRGYSPAETIVRWPKVREGEEKHIFPFQELSDSMFNTALAYETSLLKGYATRYLMEIPPGHPAQVKGYQLRRSLDLFVSVGSEHVPPTSILREFIGGSGFSYS
ncbi:MAG: nucleoside kinase [Myxococcota bacterium]|jgi:uridine kinase|nr:nucleoside kinase [Myxococcota bacterium]